MTRLPREPIVPLTRSGFTTISALHQGIVTHKPAVSSLIPNQLFTSEDFYTLISKPLQPWHQFCSIAWEMTGRNIWSEYMSLFNSTINLFIKTSSVRTKRVGFWSFIAEWNWATIYFPQRNISCEQSQLGRHGRGHSLSLQPGHKDPQPSWDVWRHQGLWERVTRT